MKKIVVMCGNGLGSSLMVEMNINAVLKSEGIEAEVVHMDLSSATGTPADVYVVSNDLKEAFPGEGKTVIGLTNLLSKDELKEKLIPALKN